MLFLPAAIASVISHPGSSFLHTVFWVSLTLIFYTYLGYPLLLWCLTLGFRWKPALPSDDLAITVLICAHNEQASIEAKLLNTLTLNYPRDRVQIIVASDGSTDATDDIVRLFSDRGVLLVRTGRQSGKTHAQNVAVQHATGDIIVFSDATALYHPDALRMLAGNYSDPAVGGCSGRYVYVGSNGESLAGSGTRAYADYDNTLRSLQSKVWSITGCCGCIYSVRRSLYTPLERHVISDLVQPLHILKKGYFVKLEPRALAWETSATTTRQEFSMRVRVVARALAGLFSVGGLLLPWRSPWAAFQIWSHKLLRWSVALLLIALLASSAGLVDLPMFRMALAVQLSFYMVALSTALLPTPRRWRVLRLPLYFCTINAAAVVGFVQFLRGKRYVAWSPVREGIHAS